MSEHSNLNSSDLQDRGEPSAMLKNEVYSNVLSKLRSLQDKSDQEECRIDVLKDGATYIAELIVAIEEDKNSTMSKETALSIERGFSAFTTALGNIEINTFFANDSASAYETFYTYMHLLNLTGMKNYLKQLDMNKLVKILYGEVASIIFNVIVLAVTYSKFTIVDLKEPLDNQEPLQLMLHFVKDDLAPDSSRRYSIVKEFILMFLWNYSDKTVIVPNLIKARYPEAVLERLSLINR
jgi:hypothetical protein